MKMRGAYAYYRAQSAFEQEDGSTERIIKICMQAFPSIWVSCIAVSELPLAEKKNYPVFRQCPCVFVIMFWLTILRVYRTLLPSVRCTDLSHPLRSPESELSSLTSFSYHNWSLPLHSPGSEYPLTRAVFLPVMTYLCPRALQEVSPLRSLASSRFS